MFGMWSTQFPYLFLCLDQRKYRLGLIIKICLDDVIQTIQWLCKDTSSGIIYTNSDKQEDKDFVLSQ